MQSDWLPLETRPVGRDLTGMTVCLLQSKKKNETEQFFYNPLITHFDHRDVTLCEEEEPLNALDPQITNLLIINQSTNYKGHDSRVKSLGRLYQALQTSEALLYESSVQDTRVLCGRGVSGRGIEGGYLFELWNERIVSDLQNV